MPESSLTSPTGRSGDSQSSGSETDPSAPDVSVPDVEFRNVVKHFDGVVAVDGIDFVVPSGSFYALLGPSGCGKTTSLRMIAGFEEPTGGEVRVTGRSVVGVPPNQRDVNTVFQHYALFPHMNVAANVGYGLRQRRPRIGKEEISERVDKALDLVRLSAYGSRRIGELSGGQQQRVALARALINHPRVLLLDEPLGALDLKLRKEMQLELKELQQRVGITFVFVTHDQEEALSMSDRIAVMRDGRIEQEGTPTELYDTPRSRFVADFLGGSNFIEGIVHKIGDELVLQTDAGVKIPCYLPVDCSLVAGSRAVASVRPERVVVAQDDLSGSGMASMQGQADQITFLGDQIEYHLSIQGVGHVLARVPNTRTTQNQGTRPGDRVTVGWSRESAVLMTT